MQIADGTTTNYFLTAFGRSPRATVCEGEATTDPSLSQALHLLNGSSVHSKIQSGKVIQTWVQEGKLTSDQVIDRIFIRCLSRMPTPEEKTELLASIEGQENPVPALEDIFWAVLNGREFVFNH